MKRFSLFLAAFLWSTSLLLVPQSTYAFSWEWVPRVLQFTSTYRGTDTSRYPGYECLARNALGNCVIESYAPRNTLPNKAKLYRHVTSYNIGGDPTNVINLSNCQYDDVHRQTARFTDYSDCDYGEPN